MNWMKLNHIDDLKIRTIKSFTDILILKHLKSHPLSSGYQVLRHLYDGYDVLCSPGTLYKEIYLLERKGLIKAEGDQNSRIYSLTDEGQKVLETAVKTSKQIQELVSEILSIV